MPTLKRLSEMNKATAMKLWKRIVREYPAPARFPDIRRHRIEEWGRGAWMLEVCILDPAGTERYLFHLAQPGDWEKLKEVLDADE